MTETRTLELGLGTTGLAVSDCSECGGGASTGGCRDCGAGGGGCSGGCGCSAGCSCGSGVSERPRWFAGQLVSPPDLTAVQDWTLARLRRHNRMLHGWGISCGLVVAATMSQQSGEQVPWSVTLGSGYALSGCGDEVCVPCPVTIDIRQPRPDPADACPPPVDPWCAPVRSRRDPERVYYLAVRYAERLVRPVQASACGCGCDGDPCEYSRIEEGYELAILEELPDCYQRETSVRGQDVAEVAPNSLWGGSTSADLREAIACSPRMAEQGGRPCPDCCSPWVVLADLRVDATGTVRVSTVHRRYLVTFANYGFTCGYQRVVQEERVLSAAERDVVVSSFANSAGELARKGAPDALVAAPALSLRGAARSRVLRDLIGQRTVAELAKSDLEGLRAAATGMGAEPEAVQQLHDLASLVVRLSKG